MGEGLANWELELGLQREVLELKMLTPQMALESVQEAPEVASKLVMAMALESELAPEMASKPAQELTPEMASKLTPEMASELAWVVAAEMASMLVTGMALEPELALEMASELVLVLEPAQPSMTGGTQCARAIILSNLASHSNKPSD